MPDPNVSGVEQSGDQARNETESTPLAIKREPSAPESVIDGDGVTLGEIRGRADCNHFALILAPIFKQADWRWNTGHGGFSCVPSEKWIADATELLWRWCRDGAAREGWFAASGGLMVVLENGRYLLKIDYALAPFLRNSGTSQQMATGEKDQQARAGSPDRSKTEAGGQS
jgi:hypothetical protein